MDSDHSFFIEIINPDGNNQKIKLMDERTVLGRHSSCSIQIGIDNFHVSNRHAALHMKTSGVVIEDLESTNGIYINENRIKKHNLKHNDIIRFGTQGSQLRFITEAITISPESTPKRLNSVSEKSTAGKSSVSTQKQNSFNTDGLFSVSPETNVPYNNSSSLRSEAEVSSPDSKHSSIPLSVSSEYDNQFDVSPDAKSNDNTNISETPSKRIAIPSEAHFDRETPSGEIRQSENNIFDIAPEMENNNHSLSPPNENSTFEIARRLQNQCFNTQDIDILAKDSRKRDKILRSRKLDDNQRHMISTFIRAYSSFKRSNRIIFGTIIFILGTFSIILGYKYLKTKHLLSEIHHLKDQISEIDIQIEKTRHQKGSDSREIQLLYNRLESAQTRFESVKATLKTKDHDKIYSDTIEYFLDQIMSDFNESNYIIPRQMLRRVKYYIGIFTTNQRRSTELLFRRKHRYFDYFREVFSRNNLPSSLSYVAMQESLLDPTACSSAGAVGMWQFMQHTGKRFNLVINDIEDERLDWKKSTIAAARYFSYLISQFGEGRGTLLAIAAYNAGENKLARALKSTKGHDQNHDFWYLYRTSTVLAMETREYIPQILARIIIDKHPDLYGFN